MLVTTASFQKPPLPLLSKTMLSWFNSCFCSFPFSTACAGLPSPTHPFDVGAPGGLVLRFPFSLWFSLFWWLYLSTTISMHMTHQLTSLVQTCVHIDPFDISSWCLKDTSNSICSKLNSLFSPQTCFFFFFLCSLVCLFPRAYCNKLPQNRCLKPQKYILSQF